MSPAADPRELIARLLRQRAELGASELILEGMSRNEALAMAAGARATVSPTRTEAAQDADRSAGHPLPVLPASYEELRRGALSCTRCRLSQTRTQVVFSDGVVDAKLVVVGEAPGANEDATGLPFVGAAGQFLDLLLGTVGLSRQDTVYICNVLKCRPPGNRNPLPDEIEACSPYLKKQLELVAPRALLAVGSFSAISTATRESRSSSPTTRRPCYGTQAGPARSGTTCNSSAASWTASDGLSARSLAPSFRRA